MKKTNKKKLEEFIRVDHAGERGAIKIYEGQLLALNTIIKNDDLKQTIKRIATPKVDFDVMIASPDMMPQLGKLGKLVMTASWVVAVQT